MAIRTVGAEDRYGARHPGRRAAVVAGSAVLAAAFVGWVGWAGWQHATPEVSSELVGFRVAGEHQTLATIDVRLAGPEVRGQCTLRAYAEDHTVVGELVLPVSGARLGEGGRIQVTIRTERRATAVEGVGCTTADQGRPR